jgi:hypothetical protein
MAGTADDEDYHSSPGTVVIMSYGPDGPAPQPIPVELCRRQTREHSSVLLDEILAAERMIYRERLARSVEIPRPETVPAAAGTECGSTSHEIIELALDDLLKEIDE